MRESLSYNDAVAGLDILRLPSLSHTQYAVDFPVALMAANKGFTSL